MPVYFAEANTSERVCLTSSLPWETVKNNVKTWKFLLINYDPVTYNTVKLDEIARTVEDYIATYFFPTYRVKVQIDMITPPTNEQFIANGLSPNSVRSLDVSAVPDAIPVYLVNEFSPDIPNGFGIAFHGQVNDSVMNGIHPWFYLNPSTSQTQVFNALCPGMPFIIIPRGSVGTDGTDNGIAAEVAHNLAAGYGPTEFYDALAYTLAFEIIEVLDNPAGLIYILSGNTLQELGAGSNPKETAYLKSLCAPFSSGGDNIRTFKGHAMPNFALPSYFHPYVDQLSQGKAVYDSMGNGVAPLTPYKGTQFVMYQDAHFSNGVLSDLSDLQAGVYVSPVDAPFSPVFASFGSIYTWEGWGFELAQNNLNAQEISVPVDNELDAVMRKGRKNVLRQADLSGSTKKAGKVALKATAHGIFPGRKHTGTTLAAVAKSKHAKKLATSHQQKNHCRKQFNPKKPQLLPFQYINAEGFLTQRYAFINYSKNVDTATLIAATQNVVDASRRLFLPHWNMLVEATIYNVSSATTREEALAMLPTFDGTFIPVLLTVPSQFRTDTTAVFLLGGGAFDVNNVPDSLAGPTVDFYLKDNGIFPVPDLLLGSPLVVISDLNIHGTSLVTTSEPGVGPFTMGVASFEPSNVTFPIVAPAVLSPFGDLTLCATPPNNAPFQGKVVVFTNDPPCATPGPQRYTNVNNSGAIASISVPRAASTLTFPGNLGLPYVKEPSQFMVGTSEPEGNALIAAIQKAKSEGREITITINAPVFPTYSSVQELTVTLSHEFYELARDPNYATYVATSNPPSDKTIVFSQIEAADPAEAIGGPRTLNAAGKIFLQTSFPTPAYFIPNLKFKLYDDQGLCPKPLIPFSRQQTAVHQAPINGVNQPISPMQFLSLETSVPGAIYSQASFAGLDIFEASNYFAPFSDEFLFAPDIDFHDMPFFSVYHKLLTNDNLFAYDHVDFLGPISDQLL